MRQCQPSQKKSRSRNSWLYLRVSVAALLAGLVVGLVAESPATATTPPTTSVLVPAAGATVSGTTATLGASASNATSVEFWLLGGSYGYSGDLIGTATPTLYGWLSSWNTTTVPNGSYVLLSEAFNDGSSAFSAGVSITVSNPLTTSVLFPAAGATVSGTTATLGASASNATSVEFWLLGGSYGYSGDLIGTATPTLYGWLSSWNTTTVPNGSYVLLSEAFNDGSSAFSAGVSITVSNPLTTSVLFPAAGATVSGTTATLGASASNATSVEFWLLGGSYGYSGDLIGTATPTLYGWLSSWNTTTVPNGSYVLLSEAFNDGSSAFSAGVNITVTDAAATPRSSVFPVAVWLQDPAETNNIESGYSTLGAAAAAEGINTFLGFYDWPSAYGVDNSTGGQGSQFQAACNAGEYVIAGGDPSSNTSAESVASIEKIASDETQAGTGSSCTNYLAGYDWDDEPAECSTNVAAQVAAIHADDPTRPTVDNMASWVTWGDSGCDSTADENFSAPSFLSSDDYHNTDPWNVGSCTGAAHVSKSPWADCSWLYGYQGAIQTSLAAGKPTWEFIESGTDELGFSGQNGSTCNTTTNACSNGNEYNATAPQVNADAWSAIVNGVTGIEWFCHGTAQGQNLSDSDCMGGNGSASNAIFSNLRYIDDTIQSYAPELLSSTQGSCTMQPSTHSTIDNAS